MPKTTHATAKTTRLYRLEPLQDMLGRDEWAASIIKEACWVKAANEHEARALVEVETRTRQGNSPIKLPFFSPWSSSAFCEKAGKDAPVHHGIPAGMVVTANGPIDPHLSAE